MCVCGLELLGGLDEPDPTPGWLTKHITHPPYTQNTQWHVKFAFNYTSQGLIDPNAVYYAELLSGPMTGRAYKIKGRFPPSIYFSWQVRMMAIVIIVGLRVGVYGWID